MRKIITLEPSAPEWLYIPDVPYHHYGTLTRSLQMLVPHGAGDKRFPLIVYLPGSAFYRQDMYCNLISLGAIARRGFVVAALQYRESEIAKFPAQIQDVHNAVTFLKEHVSEYRIDPENIFLWGHSSGAYNSLMAGVTAGAEAFDGGANHRFRGIVSVSAPSYLSYGALQPETYDPEDYRPELDMLGLARFEDDEALFQNSMVASHIHRDRPIPPILLIHGDEDRDVTVENSRKLYRKLSSEGKEAVYYELQGLGHGGPFLWDSPLLDLAERFIQDHLRNGETL